MLHQFTIENFQGLQYTFRLNELCKQPTIFFLTEDAAVELPIKFFPRYPGRYPCHILLQSTYDIRVYKIECVVNTDTAEAELQFVTPAYQAVVQDIPIVCLFCFIQNSEM